MPESATIRPTGNHPLESGGNWLQVLQPAEANTLRPALFVDRDGVLVEEVGYLHRVADMKVIRGAGSALAAVRARGWFVVLVTNQAGIGRGIYGWNDFCAVQESLLAALAEDALPHMVLACPFHPDGQAGYRHPSHPWRKPGAGMILAAARALPIDLHRSWIVGDKSVDVEAGRAAGLAGAFHVLTGHGRRFRDRSLSEATADFAVHPLDSIAALPAALERALNCRS